MFDEHLYETDHGKKDPAGTGGGHPVIHLVSRNGRQPPRSPGSGTNLFRIDGPAEYESQRRSCCSQSWADYRHSELAA